MEVRTYTQSNIVQIEYEGRRVELQMKRTGGEPFLTLNPMEGTSLEGEEPGMYYLIPSSRAGESRRPPVGSCYSQQPGTGVACGLERGHEGPHSWEADVLGSGLEAARRSGTIVELKFYDGTTAHGTVGKVGDEVVVLLDVNEDPFQVRREEIRSLEEVT